MHPLYLCSLTLIDIHLDASVIKLIECSIVQILFIYLYHDINKRIHILAGLLKARKELRYSIEYCVVYYSNCPFCLATLTLYILCTIKLKYCLLSHTPVSFGLFLHSLHNKSHATIKCVFFTVMV